MRYELRSKPSVEDGITYAEDGLYNYEPGNGTRYLVAMQSGFSAEGYKAMGAQEGSTVVTLLNHPGTGSAILAPEGFLAPHYLREKFVKVSLADAVVLAEFLAHVMPGRVAQSCEDWQQQQDELAQTAE